MNKAIYVPRDFSAQAMGVEKTANAIIIEADKRNQKINIIRTGSFGMYWLEPLITIEHNKQRYAYGPIEEKDVPGLFDTDFLSAGKHELFLGPVKEIDFLKIDVEGFELAVIQGSKNMLASGIKCVQFEYGGTYHDANTTLQQITQISTHSHNVA